MSDLLRISATSHGLNYLPEYYAAASGRFAELSLTVTSKSCEPWTGVLDDLADGTADVALAGFWVPAMYAGVARDLVVVGQLNGRFPMAIVTREPIEGSIWDWMRGRTILVPGAGSTAPYEFTAGLMREAGADPAASRFTRDLPADMLAELFGKGLGDAFVADLLTAHKLNRNGAGVLACNLAEVGGLMPNSVYLVRRDRLQAVHSRLVLFLTGIDDAIEALSSGTADATGLLAAEWPQEDTMALQAAATALAASNTWCGIGLDPAACQRWIAMLHKAGLLIHESPYEDLVDTSAIDAVRAAKAGQRT